MPRQRRLPTGQGTALQLGTGFGTDLKRAFNLAASKSQGSELSPRNRGEHPLLPVILFYILNICTQISAILLILTSPAFISATGLSSTLPVHAKEVLIFCSYFKLLKYIQERRVKMRIKLLGIQAAGTPSENMG